MRSAWTVLGRCTETGCTETGHGDLEVGKKPGAEINEIELLHEC